MTVIARMLADSPDDTICALSYDVDDLVGGPDIEGGMLDGLLLLRCGGHLVGGYAGGASSAAAAEYTMRMERKEEQVLAAFGVKGSGVGPL